jgi:hypothetical protein
MVRRIAPWEIVQGYVKHYPWIASGSHLTAGSAVWLLLGRLTEDQPTSFFSIDAVLPTRADGEAKGHHIVMVQVETRR